MSPAVLWMVAAVTDEEEPFWPCLEEEEEEEAMPRVRPTVWWPVMRRCTYVCV